MRYKVSNLTLHRPVLMVIMSEKIHSDNKKKFAKRGPAVDSNMKIK